LSILYDKFVSYPEKIKISLPTIQEDFHI